MTLISSYRRFIKFDDAFIRLWDWNWVYDCLLVCDQTIQMIAVSCLEILLNLNTSERNMLAKRFLKIENFTDLDFLE